MDVARESQAIAPRVAPSPLPGFEYVRGYGVYALPFDVGRAYFEMQDPDEYRRTVAELRSGAGG